MKKVELSEDEKHYFSLYNHAPIAYCTLNEEGLIQEANSVVSLLLGLPQKDFIQKPFIDFIQKDYLDSYYKFRKKLLNPGDYAECELKLLKSLKKEFWAELSAGIENSEDGLELRLLFKDISAHKKESEKSEITASIFRNTGEAIMITESDGTIYDVNEAFEFITGYSRDEVIGKNPHILSSGYYKKDFYRVLWHTLHKQGSWSGEIWNLRKSGEAYAEKLTINTIKDIQGVKQYYVALFSDITRSKEHVKELEHIAHYDVLTGLPNRVLLSDRLQQNMMQVRRRKQSLALVFIDLDGFKEVNDTHGHHVGDKLLIALAKKMQRTLREEDTLARIGGDEFVAVLSDLQDTQSSLPLINRLLYVAAQEFLIDDLSIRVSASLGVSFYPQSKKIDPEHLLRQADQAMYEAKISGKNRYHIFKS